MLTPLVYLQQRNVKKLKEKKKKKTMKLANINKENIRIFQTTWGILMNFLEKLYLTIMLEVTKNQGFIFSLLNTVLEKPQWGINLTPNLLKVKNVLPKIISWNQNEYVKNRCINEKGRLISDLMEMNEVFINEGFLFTVDIEKAFESVNNLLLIAIL